jgi:IS5 family transposase
MGNPLERLNKTIDFEMFRPLLEEELLNHEKTSKAGAKPIDVLLMFKILLLQRWHNLSDEVVEFQITDRQSFKDFLGLTIGDKVPDARTIWAFKNKIAKKGLDDKLFDRFSQFLESKGVIINKGQIIDASFVEVPRQRNKREENDKIKAGEGAELWNDKPHKKCHKDIDARWVKKNGRNYYGYKNHVKVDAKSKLIRTYTITSASVHDSQPIETLLEDSDREQEIYADSAYAGEPIDVLLEDRGIINKINEKGYKDKPLTETQKQNNRSKSSVRSRVEHVLYFRMCICIFLLPLGYGMLKTTTSPRLTLRHPQPRCIGTCVSSSVAYRLNKRGP